MNNNCIYLKQKLNHKFECKRSKKEICLKDCSNCPYKEYKKCTITVQRRIDNNKECTKKSNYCAKMKQRSSKLAKLERNRFSLFTDDLDHCIICGKKKDNIHEVIYGKNRINSMKFGLTIPLCNYHHKLIHSNPILSNEYKKKGQALFDRAYPDLKFEDIFKKNYL